MNRAGDIAQRFFLSYPPAPVDGSAPRVPMRAVTVRVEIEAGQGIDEPVVDLASRIDAVVSAWERDLNT